MELFQNFRIILELFQQAKLSKTKFNFSFFGNLEPYQVSIRGGPRTAELFKMKLFVILVNGFQSLTIITKSSNLDVAAVLDPPL